MRELNEIAGFAILLFLITAIGYYKDNLTRGIAAIISITVVICMIVIKIPKPGDKQKKKGYILRG